MTREEAIICKIYLEDLDEYHTCNEYKLLMGLLEQEPCEDAISRQAVLDLIADYDLSMGQVVRGIHALPPVSMENPNRCGDAISRQAVNKLIDELARAISDERCFISRGRSPATIMQDILDLPSVSTEKTGRWEWNQYDYNPNLGNWHCSECRSVVIECVDKNGKSGIPLYKYCPQCGAKMGVEE